VSSESLSTFVVAVVLITLVPGPAMALILRRAALRGVRGTLPTIVGLEVGLYLWALLTAAGFAALVAVSEVAFVVLRVVGAVVLLYLGAKALLAAWRGGAAEVEVEAPTSRWWKGFGEALVVSLANPKAAIFMIAFYPQFVPADRPLFATTAALALVQVAIETVLLTVLAAGVARAGGWFRKPTIRRRLEAVTGTVLVALGVRVAVVQ
jgi:threonine/homoserine/homoserine lactone efflux protein